MSEIKPSDRWLESELFSLRLENHCGEFARRAFTAWVKSDPKIWGSLPVWFRKQAREYLGRTPKPRPQNEFAKSIMEAIKATPIGD